MGSTMLAVGDSFAQEAGKSVFYWFDGPFSFAVVAELQRPDLQSIAESVYRTYQG